MCINVGTYIIVPTLFLVGNYVCIYLKRKLTKITIIKHLYAVFFIPCYFLNYIVNNLIIFKKPYTNTLYTYLGTIQVKTIF